MNLERCICCSEGKANLPTFNLLGLYPPQGYKIFPRQPCKCDPQGIQRGERFHFNSCSLFKAHVGLTYTWFPFLLNFLPTNSYKCSNNKMKPRELLTQCVEGRYDFKLHTSEASTMLLIIPICSNTMKMKTILHLRTPLG